MATTEYDEMIAIVRHSLKPDNMTDEELLEISLSTLTKNLAPTLRRERIVRVYARWLDIHCVRNSPMTYHWANTVKQWVHALRHLGFSPCDIITGLGLWTLMVRRHGMRYAPSRALPSPREVEMFHAFDTVQGYHPTSRVEFGGSEYTFDHVAVPSPSTYVYNRCGVPGHYLQLCPTNMNQPYDQPSSQTYACAICHETHYGSLCPLNPGPTLLNQQRRLAGITVGDHHKPLYLQNPTVVEAHLARGRKHSHPQTSSPHSRPSHGGSPTPEKKQSLRKRIRRIEIYEDKLANGMKLDFNQAEMVRKKDGIQTQLEALDENNMGQTDGENPIHPAFNNMHINQPMHVIPYSEFTQKLIECQREEMTQTVNVTKARPTAIERWELLEADNRNLIAMAVSGMDITYDPFLDEKIFHETLATAAAEHHEPKYPSIYGPGYNGFEIPVITSIFDHIPTFGAKKYEASKSGSGSSLLLDADVLAAGPLTPLLTPSIQAQLNAVYPKNFNPVIAPPPKTVKFNKHADLRFGSGMALNQFHEYYEAQGHLVGQYPNMNTEKFYCHAASNSSSSSSSILDENVPAVGLQTPHLPMNLQNKKAVFYQEIFSVPTIGPVLKTKRRVPKDITNIPKNMAKREQSRPCTRAYTLAIAGEDAGMTTQYI